MVQKKVNRIFYYSAINARDTMITKALSHYHIDFGVTIMNIISTNPVEIAVSIIAIKLGISNKIILGLIIAFLV